LASHFYKSKNCIITVSAFQLKEDECYLQVSSFDTEKNERVENRLQQWIKGFIVSSITSSEDDIIIVSKDARVMKAHEKVLRDRKKWETMV
jgi:hypothetical protein